MQKLQEMRTAQRIGDVARILGYKPSGLAYVIYKMPEARKYTSFEIPKRSGGTRLIRAPGSELRLLQRRVANVLYACLDEIEKNGTGRRSFAHGFERKRSIVTNASLHKRRRYVLNLDLEDFFPSINFGRVRGFFIKDNHFAFHQKVATIIAQIACHNNELPQGSPCSPVISNLIGHLLDSRLAGFAKSHKCTYSRYADDITFSTNRKDFPPALAVPDPATPSQWQLGAPLVAKIEGSGFRVNLKKTRMQYRGSRQVVTGLLVNEKVNIHQDYFRVARAMCHELFSTGTCYRMVQAGLVVGAPKGNPVKVPVKHLGVLQGILAHMHYVKGHNRSADKKKVPDKSATKNLYHRFLFYKNFVALERPLIVPEGKTDSIYLRAAIKSLGEFHPQLGRIVDGAFTTTVCWMNFTRTIEDVLLHGKGGSALAHLISEYRGMIKGFHHVHMTHPVILVADNDEGAKPVFNTAKKNYDVSISYDSMESFYHIYANLYVVKTPENGSGSQSCIEHLFHPDLLKTKIGGKTFELDIEKSEKGKYSKQIFAQQVVRRNIDTIDFSGFKPMLERIMAVLNDYPMRISK